MNELVKALLKKLGYDITDEVLNDPEKVKALKVDDIYNEIIDNQKEVLLADETFIEPIKRDVRGELAKGRQKTMIDLGLVPQDVADKFSDKSKLDDMLKYAADQLKLAKAKGSGDTDKDKAIEQLNADIAAREAEIKRLKDEEIPAVESKWQKEFTAREMNSFIRSNYEKNLKGKLIAEESVLYPAIESKLKSMYDFDYKDGQLTLLEKGKTTKAFKNSKPYGIDQAFNDIAEELQVIKKQEPINKERRKEDPDPTKKPKVSSRFEQRLAEREAATK